MSEALARALRRACLPLTVTREEVQKRLDEAVWDCRWLDAKDLKEVLALMPK